MELHKPLLENIHWEHFSYFDVLDKINKFFIRYFAIHILIGCNHGSIRKLLHLNVSQIVSNEHFEGVVEVAIGNVAIAVQIVYLESDFMLFFHIA